MTDKDKPDMRDSHRTDESRAAEKEVGDAPFTRAVKAPGADSQDAATQGPATEAPTTRQ